MSFFTVLYTEVIWRPLFNGLIFFYNTLPGRDFGVAVVALTVVIRLILAPLFWKAQKAQKTMALLQPELKKVREEFKKDPQARAKAEMELWSKHGVNPFSGCFSALLQFPILIAMFRVFQQALNPSYLSYLYFFVGNPGTVRALSLGIMDLTKPNLILGIVAAAAQYLQLRMVTQPPASGASNDFASAFQKQSLIMLPLMILLLSTNFPFLPHLPSSLMLYWTTMSILGILQEIFLNKIRGREAG